MQFKKASLFHIKLSFKFVNKNIDYTGVAREMYPLSPGGRIYFMNYQLVRYIPLFQFDKFNRILIIRKTKKFEIVIYTT